MKSISVYQLEENMTFADMFKAAIGSSDEEVIKLHTLTEHEINNLEQGYFRMERDSWANFIPVENQDGTVSVVGAYWHGAGWYRYRDSLDNDNVWDRDNRLVLSNSAALTLDPSDPFPTEIMVGAVKYRRVKRDSMCIGSSTPKKKRGRVTIKNEVV